MQVTLKLFASLAGYLPSNKKNSIEADIELAEGSTIGDVISLYKIPSKSAHLVMVNGVYIKPEERDQYALKSNDALAICPPVAGGWLPRIYRMPQFDRNMGCTSADLMRWLPQALGELYTNTSLVIDGQLLKEATQPQLRIFGSSQPVRQIALLEIPVLQVRLQFSENWSQEDCETVLNRFDLYTRRGGG